MNDFLKEEEIKNNSQSEVTNKLLMEMVRNQKNNMKNLVKVFISTIVCYTILLIAMVVGYFVYESQFEVVETETETIRYEQETASDDGGNAIGIINNNGDWSYGESEASSNNNKGKDEIEGE